MWWGNRVLRIRMWCMWVSEFLRRRGSLIWWSGLRFRSQLAGKRPSFCCESTVQRSNERRLRIWCCWKWLGVTSKGCWTPSFLKSRASRYFLPRRKSSQIKSRNDISGSNDRRKHNWPECRLSLSRFRKSKCLLQNTKVRSPWARPSHTICGRTQSSSKTLSRFCQSSSLKTKLSATRDFKDAESTCPLERTRNICPWWNSSRRVSSRGTSPSLMCERTCRKGIKL